jgi:hypothetical protein
MNYQYEIILNDEKQESIVTECDNSSNNKEMWFLTTFISYSEIWRDNDSFVRTKKWISNNYPELLI